MAEKRHAGHSLFRNAKPLSPCLNIEVFGKMEKRLSVSFREARYHRRRRQFTPTALASTDNRRRYDFGDVRVATLTLLTLTALSG